MERFPLPLGAWDGLRYFIVALPEPSINYVLKDRSILFSLSFVFLLLSELVVSKLVVYSLDTPEFGWVDSNCTYNFCYDKK